MVNKMKKFLLAGLLAPVFLLGCQQAQPERNALRAPAYPLVTIDPYTSAWSMYDHLYDGPVKHWTGAEFPLIGALKVDGTVYRFLGKEEVELSALAPLAAECAWRGSYTFSEPAGKWYEERYKPVGWKEGPAAFGTPGYLTSTTPWTSEKVWVRREVEVNGDLSGKKVYLAYSNDDDAIFYINGVEVLNTGHECHTNAFAPIPDGVVREGKNLIAATCTDTGGLRILGHGPHASERAAHRLGEPCGTAVCRCPGHADALRFPLRSGRADAHVHRTAVHRQSGPHFPSGELYHVSGERHRRQAA